MYFIGVDLGTSACKFLLMDERGEILNITSRSYDVEYPRPGWSQQDPTDWWRAVCEGVPELLAGFDASQVAGIGCGGQMHGLVALDEKDEVIRPAILWNDGRTAEQVRYLNEEVGTARLLELTGNIAYAGFTAPKLLWMRQEEPELFSSIAHVLLPKDYLNHLLTGAYATDVSDASGTLLFDVARRTWSDEMLALCGLAAMQMPRVYESYEPIGTLRPEVAAEIGIDYPVEVVAVGSHDTASAIRALPPVKREGTRRAFLSSGTWSLLGIELDQPILTEDARLAGFTNEGGVGGKICFMQNITGLWILQRLRAQWEEEGKETDYGVLIAEAEKSGITSVIDVDAPEFQNPDGMEQTIAGHCRATGQPVPATQGDYMLCIVQSLAARYKRGIDELNRLTGQPVEELCIIGGGNQNRLLNRLTQEALGIPVASGPVEATAIGNILVQAEAFESRR